MKVKKAKEKFYLGNSNLPTAQTEYDYTPEMIKEIAKCKKNILPVIIFILLMLMMVDKK